MTSSVPSPADLATWRHAYMHGHARHCASRQVHVIFGLSDERGWRRPEIGWYALRVERDSLGRRYFCEPAAVALPQ